MTLFKKMAIIALSLAGIVQADNKTQPAAAIDYIQKTVSLGADTACSYATKQYSKNETQISGVADYVKKTVWVGASVASLYATWNCIKDTFTRTSWDLNYYDTTLINYNNAMRVTTVALISIGCYQILKGTARTFDKKTPTTMHVSVE